MKTRFFCSCLKKIIPPRNITYWYFYHNISAVRFALCDSDEDRIWEVEVTPHTDETKEPLYWAWWDNEEQRFFHVYYYRHMVEMCFAYGSEIEEKHNRGKIYPVQVRVVRSISSQDGDKC